MQQMQMFKLNFVNPCIPLRLLRNVNDDKSIWMTAKEMINLELMKKPTFILFVAAAFFNTLGFFIPLIFLPDLAMDRGIDVIKANFLIPVYGELCTCK